MTASSKYHFTPNTAPTSYTRKFNDYRNYKLNSDSAKAHQEYMYSAPPYGITGKHITAESKELKPRSSLYLPLKTRLPEEAKRLQQEAEKILRSVQEKAEEEYEQRLEVPEAPQEKQEVKETPPTRKKKKRARIAFGGSDGLTADKDLTSSMLPTRKTLHGETYEQFCSLKQPKKPVLPDNLESPFLSAKKNKEVWDWITHDDEVTDFSHFMAVCS